MSSSRSERDSAIAIQCAWRKKLAVEERRRRHELRTNAFTEECRATLEEASARTIQLAQRQRTSIEKARRLEVERAKRFEEECRETLLVHSARIIQQGVRSHCAKAERNRRSVERTRRRSCDCDQELQNVCALVIQRNVRAHTARAQAKSQSVAICDQDFQRDFPPGEIMMTCAATLIQTLFRKAKAAKSVAAARQARKDAFERECAENLKQLAKAEPMECCNMRRVVEDNGVDVPLSSPENDGGFMRVVAAETIQAYYRTYRQRKLTRCSSVPCREQPKERSDSLRHSLSALSPPPSLAPTGCPLSLRGFSLANSAPPATVLAPLTFARKNRGRLEPLPAPPKPIASSPCPHEVPAQPQPLQHNSALDYGGRGRGLATLFATVTNLLLEPKQRVRNYWGVRIMHCIANELKSKTFLVQLPLTCWIQGPLGSILPATARVSAFTQPSQAAAAVAAAHRSPRLLPLSHSPSTSTTHSSRSPRDVTIRTENSACLSTISSLSLSKGGLPTVDKQSVHH